MIKILFLEDDKLYRETILDFLEDSGFDIDFAEDGQIFLDKIFKKKYDIYLLDINVPCVNGYEILKLLFDYNDSTPSLVLTSIPNSSINSFKAGCSSYLNKHDASTELLLRINSLIKRQYGTYEDRVEIDETFIYNFFTKELYVGCEKVLIGFPQIRILECLLQNKNQIVTLEKLENFVYPTNYDDKKNALRFHISKLRKIFKSKYIISHKKRGYSFY